ncbi:hypothetical protein [Streptomyces sp. SAJ15]|uniref:hypothetical protein n=1 Tax=Streptomyces sp. SAJ15 TaxID=2011095 RepID=UPI001185CC57|nr:hypothetical protein [Streptomyces sp. SAJ15]TVL93730.1 hypothetical protein CD790_01360 [Streptomyces sp. SAJ15]
MTRTRKAATVFAIAIAATVGATSSALADSHPGSPGSKSPGSISTGLDGVLDHHFPGPVPVTPEDHHAA